MTKLRMAAWIALTIAATYVIAEWSVLHKRGLHDLRTADAAVGGSAVGAGLFSNPVAEVVPVEPERLALQAQVDKLEQTFGQYRAVKDRQIADLMKLIANLEKQIQVLTAQRAPSEQVAALRAASQPVRWTLASPVPAGSVPNLATLARAVGFTKVEVRR